MRGKRESDVRAARKARSEAKAARRKKEALAMQQSRVQGGPRAVAPREWVKTIALDRPRNVWGQIVVPSTVCGLLERRVLAIGDGNPLHVLRPDTGRDYLQLATCFDRANFVSSLWNWHGAVQLLRWVAPSLPPPGLSMVEQPYKRRLGEGEAQLSVALLLLESRHQPTLTPEHTDPTPSVLCIITGRKVLKLCEEAAVQQAARAAKEAVNVASVMKARCDGQKGGLQRAANAAFKRKGGSFMDSYFSKASASSPFVGSWLAPSTDDYSSFDLRSCVPPSRPEPIVL